MIKNISFIKIFGLTLICLSLSTNAFSQNYTVVDFGSLKDSPATYSSEINKSEVEEISALVYDLNPTIFIGSSGYKILGEEAPVKAELSAGNFQNLSTANPGFNNVKLMKLKVENEADLNASFDLSTLQSFTNLEYIFIECTFKCSATRISNMFSNVGNVKILYVISTPE
jgi:hypothetical protein